ncbi:MAG: hypothetical protein ABSG32_32400 [Terriglobia bacterium]|jgi:hypothetical protein
MSGAVLFTWAYSAIPAVVRGEYFVAEAREVTPHPHNKQSVGPPARDG